MANKNRTINRRVRICMKSERYEVAASLFDAVYGNPREAQDYEPEPLSPEDELMMGILSDEGSESGYFGKPADPAVLRAKRTGEATDATETIEIYTEGIMTLIPDGEEYTVAVLYEESELTGMEGATSTVTYRTDDRGLVTMIRSGTVSTALTFREHHRAICTYDTPYMPFQIGIHALVVDNRLDEDGVLVLDYIIEIRGAKAERCRMEMTVHTDD